MELCKVQAQQSVNLGNRKKTVNVQAGRIAASPQLSDSIASKRAATAMRNIFFAGRPAETASSKFKTFSDEDKAKIDRLFNPTPTSEAQIKSNEILQAAKSVNKKKLRVKKFINALKPSKNITVKELSYEELRKEALSKNEGVLVENSEHPEIPILNTPTERRTGRSPERYFVAPEGGIVKDKIKWNIKDNPQISEKQFDRVYKKALEYLKDKDVYVTDGFAGADKNNRLPVRVISEKASQAFFVKNAFINPTKSEKKNFIPGFTVLSVPKYVINPEEHGVLNQEHKKSDVGVMIDIEKGLVLVAGTGYLGEIKKSIFTAMGFLAPARDALPMHCSANINKKGDLALFYGLSATGKTTLSADKDCKLLGDDEHLWTKEGVGNIEGGCYAKLLKMTKESEPDIYESMHLPHAIMENVKVENGKPNFMEKSINAWIKNKDPKKRLIENTRGSYPLSSVKNAYTEEVDGVVRPKMANQHPKDIFFLTYDATGTMPPIAKLSPEQAKYYFISGYTSKVGGTDAKADKITRTFSTCFGEPFMPLLPTKYANELEKKLEKHGSNVYLINTGLIGPLKKNANGDPVNRMPLPVTRALIKAARSGELAKQETYKDPNFGFEVPKTLPILDEMFKTNDFKKVVNPEQISKPSDILNPANAWKGMQAEYKQERNDLAKVFNDELKRKFVDNPNLSREEKIEMKELVSQGPKQIK